MNLTFQNNELVNDTADDAVALEVEKMKFKIADVVTHLEEEERHEIKAREGRNNFKDNNVKRMIKRNGVVYRKKEEIFGKRQNSDIDYYSSDSEFDFVLDDDYLQYEYKCNS